MSTRIIRNIGGNIISCERILKYQFRKKILCLKALNAGGIPIEYDGRTHQLARNDAMAVLGDARMEALLCKRWWASGVRNKGEWATVRKDILSNFALAARGRKEGLDSCIILDPGTRDITDRMIADAMEAVMGAVYLDGGEGALESVVRHLGLDQHKHLPVILGAHSKCPAIVERLLRSWCGV